MKFAISNIIIIPERYLLIKYSKFLNEIQERVNTKKEILQKSLHKTACIVINNTTGCITY